MPTVVIAGSKGGVGKSTLTACLAVEAARIGPIGIIDLDPQGSLAGWWQRRANANKVQLRLIEDADSLVVDKGIAARLGVGFVFIDTPPALMGVIEGAIAAADLVLIPCRPSALDVLAIDPAVDLCRLHRKPFAFVLTDVEPRWKTTASSAAALRQDGWVVDTMLTHRAAYSSAMTTGRTGPESSADPKGAASCRAEIEAVWREAQQVLAGDTLRTTGQESAGRV
jgi:chromosome partitioning protein